MNTGGIQQIELILLLLLVFVVGLGTLAERVKTPYPIVMVVGGLVLSLIPGMPHVRLDPNLVFFIILPPLLFSAATETSWRDFRNNIISILVLAFVLVAFTVAGVACVANLLIPWFDWRLGLVLGAVIATTDAIAATSIAQRVGLPENITQILEGESLVNDASGLLALEFAVAFIVSGHTPSFTEASFRLLYLLFGGIAIGLLLGKLVFLFGARIDYAPIEITVSIVTPFVAYLTAEFAKASGVLAAVAAGLYLGRKSSVLLSSTVRIETRAAWNTLTYVLNGLVFTMIGLQLPYVLKSINGTSREQLVINAAQLTIAVVVLRFIGVFSMGYAGYLIRTRLFKEQLPVPPPKGVFVIAWTGMRGVVALAAAIALPETLANGAPFPQRNMILFLTFCVIFVTLVLQGLTLPSIIRWFGLSQPSHVQAEEHMARRRMIESALAQLKKLYPENPQMPPDVYDDIVRFYQRRLAALDENQKESEAPTEHQEYYRELTTQLRKTERATIIEMRDRNEIGDLALRRIERELDLMDARFQ